MSTKYELVSSFREKLLRISLKNPSNSCRVDNNKAGSECQAVATSGGGAGREVRVSPHWVIQLRCILFGRRAGRDSSGSPAAPVTAVATL